LYSWPNGKIWNYSLLPGTNRLKSLEEVKSNYLVMHGKDSLKMLLNKIPENQEIFWVDKKWLEKCWGNNTNGSLSLPNSKTIHEIIRFCEKNDLQLSVRI